MNNYNSFHLFFWNLISNFCVNTFSLMEQANGVVFSLDVWPENVTSIQHCKHKFLFSIALMRLF